MLPILLVAASLSGPSSAAVIVSPRAIASTAGASAFVAPSYAGFGIEPSNLYSFTGGATPNRLSINLLRNLGEYTGTPPHLRIGGNTGDNHLYNSSVTEFRFVDNPSPIGTGAFPADQKWFGARYFEAIDRFPVNTPITFGLNLAYNKADYLARIVEEASAAVTQLKKVKLVSFEIGNEPDLYQQNGFRAGVPWGGPVYTKEWIQRAAAIFQQVLKPANIPSNFFEPGTTANTIGTTFQINDLTSTGISAVAEGSTKPYVSSWNQHDYFYFISVSTFPITLDVLMNLQQTYTQFQEWTKQLNQATVLGVPYALREMASVGPQGIQGISDTFGAALWNLNFFLYTATLNITSVQMHLTDISFASAWQPIINPATQSPPRVRPTYYAHAAMAQIIGKTGDTQIAPVDATASIPSEYKGRVSIYASYNKGALTSLTLINSKQSNTSNANPQSLQFTLQLPYYANQQLYISTLVASGADATQNTTWNGLTYERSGDGTPTSVNATNPFVTTASDGSVTVDLRDSSAMVLKVGSPLAGGSGIVVVPTNIPTVTGKAINPNKAGAATLSVSYCLLSLACALGFAFMGGFLV